MTGKNCLAAIFAPRHQSVSSGPLGCQGLGWAELKQGGRRTEKQSPVRTGLSEAIVGDSPRAVIEEVA